MIPSILTAILPKIVEAFTKSKMQPASTLDKLAKIAPALKDVAETESKLRTSELQHSGLTRLWRPITAIMFAIIIFIYLVIFPISELLMFWFEVPVAYDFPSLPTEVWWTFGGYLTTVGSLRSLIDKRTK